eukprot:scaffold177188_cov17-Tisochrysis_lutea.AAC.1
MQRLKDAGMMDAFAEWEREEAERQLALVASGHLDPSALTLSSPKEEEKPLYAFLLSVFDERVQGWVKRVEHWPIGTSRGPERNFNNNNNKNNNNNNNNNNSPNNNNNNSDNSSPFC